MKNGTRRVTAAISLGLMLASGPGCSSYGPPRSARTPGSSHALPAKPVVLPFTLRQGIIHVRARVNGSDLRWFALDSGAPCSLSQEIVESLKLQRRGKQTVYGIGGREKVGIYGPVTFELGGAPLLVRQVLGEQDPAQDGTAGILGRELFDDFVVEINYQNRTLTLHRPLAFNYTGPGEILQADFEPRSGPILEAQIIGTNQAPVRARLLVDTGCNGILCLRREFTEAHPELKPAGETRDAQRTGAGGTQRTRTGRIGSLRLGRWTLDKPLANYFQGHTRAWSDLAGHLGNETLRRFTVILDASRQRLILETNATFAQPFVVEVHGLVLGLEWPECRLELPGAVLIGESPDFKTFKVVEVMKKSAAAEAGLREEDLVLSINGTPMAELSVSGILGLFRQDGRVHLLRVERGQERLELRLKSAPPI